MQRPYAIKDFVFPNTGKRMLTIAPQPLSPSDTELHPTVFLIRDGEAEPTDASGVWAESSLAEYQENAGITPN